MNPDSSSSPAKRLAILGGGESGVGAALLGAAKGYEVFLSDKGFLQDHYRAQLQENAIAFEEGGHSEERILAADLVIKSPGIPEKSPLIQALRQQGIPVIGELEFAARYTQAKLIAITGSNGKTTTTLLTYHLLKEAGLNVGLGGNIGTSFAKQVIEDTHDCYVLEVSSFQLDDMYEAKADIAVLLNITPDHLDRYDYQFQHYVNAKFRIIQNQTEQDSFIYFIENPPIAIELQRREIKAKQLPISLVQPLRQGAYLEGDILKVLVAGGEFSLSLADLPLPGTHNAINCMAAILVALSMGLSQPDIEKGLASFQNAPHRLEKVATLDGVDYINDSKATNVDAVFYALGSYDRPIVWIAGGTDKGNDYTQIAPLVRHKVKALIALGADTTKLVNFFGEIVPQIYATNRLDDAVRQAREWAAAGDVVLLSPACASFDLFRNYEDRGSQFRDTVVRLPTPNA